MEQSLSRFIWDHTRREQTWILLVVLVSMIPYYMAFDLPKQIVNGPIQGQGYEAAGATQILFHMSVDVPGWGNVVLFPGIPLERLPALMALSLAFLGLVVINGFFKYYINTYKGRMGERLLRRVRFQLIDRILRFPPQQFRRIKPAEAASMVKDEIEPMGGFTGDAFVQPVMLGGQALMAMIFICVQNIWLGAVAGTIAGIQVVIIPRMRRRLIELGRQRQLTARQLSGRVGELMDGISTIHALDTSNYERADMSTRLGQIFKIRYDLYQWKFMVKFLNNFLAQLTPFVFYSFGGYLTIKGSLDVGQLVAVINAYKDLPGPLKELIDWDQARQDVQVKYEQVAEQFRTPDLIDPALHDVCLETGQIGSPLAVSALVVQDDGDKKLDRVSLSIAQGESVALIDDSGSGAETLAAVFGRAVWPSSGRVTVGGRALNEITEGLVGRRITYISSDDYLFHGSLGDNLLYGLQHAPYGKPVHTDAEAERQAKWELAEARASGNAPFSRKASWLNRDLIPEGGNGERSVEDAVGEALTASGLRADVMAMGVRARIPGTDHQALKSAIVEIRHRLQRDLAAGKVKLPIEYFDINRYNPQASIWENLLFGELPSDQAGGQILRSDYATAILDGMGLRTQFFDLGYEMASTILEFLGEGHEADDTLFGRLPFLRAEDIPVLREVVPRTHMGGVNDATLEDQLVLLRLSMYYSEPVMRIGRLTPELMAQIVEARGQLAAKMPAELRPLITLYDAATYNDAARVIDNILFGKLGRTNPDIARRQTETISAYLAEYGIERDILQLGLAEDIGIGGRRLNQAQRQKLSLARALMRDSEYYVFNKTLSVVDPRQHEAIVDATMRALQRHQDKPAVIWVLSNTRMAGHFERVVLFDRGTVEFDGSLSDLKSEQSAESSLVFT